MGALISGTTSSHGEDEVATSGNYTYVVWDSIYFTVSTDGTIFAAPLQLKNATACQYPCLAREPMISTSGPNVYVTFPSDVNGPYQTFICVSHDHGTTWTTGTPLQPCAGGELLSAPLSNTREVQVASYSSTVLVTSRGIAAGVKGTQQYVYVSYDNGKTFAPPRRVATTVQSGAETGFGSVIIDHSNGNAYIYWPHGNSPNQLWLGSSQDYATSPPGTWAVQQVSSSTKGIIGLNDPGGSQGPLAAVLNGHVYLVWEDTSTGSGDIYFVAGTQS